MRRVVTTAMVGGALALLAACEKKEAPPMPHGDF